MGAARTFCEAFFQKGGLLVGGRLSSIMLRCPASVVPMPRSLPARSAVLRFAPAIYVQELNAQVPIESTPSSLTIAKTKQLGQLFLFCRHGVLRRDQQVHAKLPLRCARSACSVDAGPAPPLLTRDFFPPPLAKPKLPRLLVKPPPAHEAVGKRCWRWLLQSRTKLS